MFTDHGTLDCRRGQLNFPLRCVPVAAGVATGSHQEIVSWRSWTTRLERSQVIVHPFEVNRVGTQLVGSLGRARRQLSVRSIVTLAQRLNLRRVSYVFLSYCKKIVFDLNEWNTDDNCERYSCVILSCWLIGNMSSDTTNWIHLDCKHELTNLLYWFR